MISHRYPLDPQQHVFLALTKEPSSHQKNTGIDTIQIGAIKNSTEIYLRKYESLYTINLNKISRNNKSNVDVLPI